MQILGTINDPGTPGKTGDDRFGYDEAAGVAWVLDGATDVTDLRPFPRAESGAAWFAQALSDWLLAHPPGDEDLNTYWAEALKAMRTLANKDSKIPLDTLPLSSSPIASGIWVHIKDQAATFCWLGDCVGLVRHEDGRLEEFGKPDQADSESEDARQLLKLTEEEMWGKLAEDRALQNSPGRWIFGLNPEAADHLNTATIPVEQGCELLLMTDGLYRLINPYHIVDEAGLIEMISDNGLQQAVSELRKFEADAKKIDRVKTRDDACAIYISNIS